LGYVRQSVVGAEKEFLLELAAVSYVEFPFINGAACEAFYAPLCLSLLFFSAEIAIQRVTSQYLLFFLFFFVCVCVFTFSAENFNDFTSRLSTYSIVKPQVIHRWSRSIHRPRQSKEVRTFFFQVLFATAGES